MKGNIKTPRLASLDTHVAVVYPVEFGQHDLWRVGHDMDGFLVVVPGFRVQALLKKGENFGVHRNCYLFDTK